MPPAFPLPCHIDVLLSQSTTFTSSRCVSWLTQSKHQNGGEELDIRREEEPSKEEQWVGLIKGQKGNMRHLSSGLVRYEKRNLQLSTLAFLWRYPTKLDCFEGIQYLRFTADLPMLKFNESSRHAQGVLHYNQRCDLDYTEDCIHGFLRSIHNHRPVQNAH